MKTINISDATNTQLDWLIAPLDPRSKGLTFGIVDGLPCGYYEEDGKQVNCLVVVGPSFSKQMRAAQKLGLANIDRYCPTHDNLQGSMLAWHHRVTILALDKDWEAQLNGWAFDEASPLVAIVRCIVANHYGEVADVPEELT